MKENPKISIIIPTYNRRHLIGDCIESVLFQSMADFEVVIVSDGSTDNTKEVVGRYDDTRIRYLEKENNGQASARNLGIVKSNGKFIAFCDDDDRIYPEHLETLCEYLDSEKEVGLVYSDAVWIYKDGSQKPKVAFSVDFDKKSLENFNYITTQTVMFRRACLDKVGFFNEDPILRNGLEDWEFFCRFSDVYGFSHIRKVTGEYTVHLGNSFHPNSSYDYSQAFFFVRTQRFHYLKTRYGVLLFDRVDHMYPFHLVQSYLNVGKFDGAVGIALEMLDLYGEYRKKSHESPVTELVVHFALGISLFAVAKKEKAREFFGRIASSIEYRSIKPRFDAFVSQYIGQARNQELKNLLQASFVSMPQSSQWN